MNEIIHNVMERFPSNKGNMSLMSVFFQLLLSVENGSIRNCVLKLFKIENEENRVLADKFVLFMKNEERKGIFTNELILVYNNDITGITESYTELLKVIDSKVISYNEKCDKSILLKDINLYIKCKTYDMIPDFLDEDTFEEDTAVLHISISTINGKFITEMDNMNDIQIFNKDYKVKSQGYSNHNIKYNKNNNNYIVCIPCENDISMYLTMNEDSSLMDPYSVMECEYNIGKCRFVMPTNINLEKEIVIDENSCEKYGLSDLYGFGSFSGFTNKDLYVEKIIHKTLLKVGLIGFSAAGVSLIKMQSRGLCCPCLDITIDRSFGIVIVSEKSNTILFDYFIDL